VSFIDGVLSVVKAIERCQIKTEIENLLNLRPPMIAPLIGCIFPVKSSQGRHSKRCDCMGLRVLCSVKPACVVGSGRERESVWGLCFGFGARWPTPGITFQNPRILCEANVMVAFIPFSLPV
jgi:hypothetical protein